MLEKVVATRSKRAMDCYTCSLYRKSSALNSFIPHVNSPHPLRIIKNHSTKTKQNFHSDASLLANQDNPMISPPIINLHFESENIPGDGINDQDFLCVMSIFGHNGWEKYARTEANFSNYSRKWIQPITVLAENKLLRFELYQIISDLYSLRHQRFIGDCEIELKEILATDKLRLPILLSYEFLRFINSPKLTEDPCLIIKHRELEQNTKGSFFFKMTYTNHVKYSAISFKPSHYFEIEMVDNDILVYRSNTVKLNPKCSSIFDTVEFNQQLLSGSSLFTPIRFKFHEVSKTDTVIFEVETTLDALTAVSITKYPVDNLQGFSIGQFEVTFIGANQTLRIDDLKLNGVSFQPIYAIDFSDGKKSSDTFKSILCNVGDALNLITQIRPLISFGFGNFSEKHNVFAYAKSYYFESAKKMIQSFYERLLTIEKTSTESSLVAVIDRCRRLAVGKWHDLRAFTVATIITSGTFVVDYEEAVNLMVDSDGLPIVFLLLTMNAPKNKFINLIHKEKNLTSTVNPNKKTSRKLLKVIPYGTQFINQFTNLKNVARSVSKMIHLWANSTKNNFSTGFSHSISFSGVVNMSSSFSISSFGSKNTDSDVEIESNITKQPSVEKCIIATGLSQSSQQFEENNINIAESDAKKSSDDNFGQNIRLSSVSNDDADDEYNQDEPLTQPHSESIKVGENAINEIKDETNQLDHLTIPANDVDGMTEINDTQDKENLQEDNNTETPNSEINNTEIIKVETTEISQENTNNAETLNDNKDVDSIEHSKDEEKLNTDQDFPQSNPE